MELLDILDENGEITGKIEERKKVHEQLLWHSHVGVFIMNTQGELLFQKRSENKVFNPNKWTRTGGHVDANETPLEAVQRETLEEVGINIPLEKFELIDIKKKQIYDNNDNLKTRFFLHNYFVVVDYDIKDYTMQKEEVSDLKYMTIEEMKEIKINNDENYTFISWEDFDNTISILEDKREEIMKK